MPRLLPLLLIGLPLAEIALLIEAGRLLGGALPVLLLLVAAALAGILLIRRQSLASLSAVRAALARNEAPGEALLDGAGVMAAGLLLILPGFLSDLAALALLIRPLRRWLAGRLTGSRGARPGFAAGRPPASGSGPVIAGEYRDVTDEPAPPGESRWGSGPGRLPGGRP
jgi:UPF0716 protein FxsA